MIKTLVKFLVVCAIYVLSIIQANAITIDVGLGDNQKEAVISANRNYRLVASSNKEVIGEFAALSRTKLKYEDDKLVISNIHGIKDTQENYNRTLNLDFQSLNIEYINPSEVDTNLMFANDKWYRGQITVFLSKNNSFIKSGFTIVNNVELERYLMGVVPSEMPSKWHPEALKTQAVCARTYTLANLNRRADLGYDVKNNTEDQVYLGYKNEKPETNAAIAATYGKVVTDYNNRVINAYYSSSAGGYTDSIEDIWGLSPKAYLVPRKDFDQESPHYEWNREFSQDDISDKLATFKVGRVLGMTILDRTVAHRVKKAVVIGTESNVQLTGEEIRHRLALPSTKFNIGFKEGKMKFAGRGFGHGIGLSQYGSKALAEQGVEYSNILKHYYPNTKILSLR